MAQNPEVKKLLADLQSDDPEVRTAAWLRAGRFGAGPLKRLARLVATGELEVSRAAKRAMWKIVRTAGAPDAGPRTKQRVVERLVELLADDQPDAVRREVLWMISELAEGRQGVAEIARLLDHETLREDARMVLQRLPSDAALDALQAAFSKAPETFKYHLAQSLRKRGVAVEGYPCQKLVPTRQTSVKPVKPA